MAIPGLHGLGFIDLVKKSVLDFVDDDLITHASALAFQVLFSLFPFVIFLVALLTFLDLSYFFAWLRAELSVFLPQPSMDTLNQVLDELQQPREGLLSLGAGIALWTASAAVRSIMHAMNIAYDVREERPLWKRFPVSILYTIGFAALLIAASTLLLVGPQAMQWLANRTGLEQTFVTIWAWLRWPVAFLMLNLTVALIYYLMPNFKQKFKFVTPGSILSTLIWVLSSWGFNLYVTNFADYSVMYGGIGAIIVLLMYFFISSAILLFGAEVNAVIEEHAGEITRPHKRSSPAHVPSADEDQPGA